MCNGRQNGTAYTATQHFLSDLLYKTVSKTNVQISDSQTRCQRLDTPHMVSIFSEGTIIIPSVILIVGSLTLQFVPKAIRMQIPILTESC
jgi:hypothetical protein